MGIQKYRCPSRINEGGDGTIIRIARGLLAKVGHADEYTQQEARIGNKLHEEGISVPKPYGIHPITIPEEFGGYYAGDTVDAYVMQYVRGVNGYKLLKKEKRLEKAKKLRDIEIEKAIEKGFHTPADVDDLGNFILTICGNVYLIDFAKWGHKDIPQLPDFQFAEADYFKCNPDSRNYNKR